MSISSIWCFSASYVLIGMAVTSKGGTPLWNGRGCSSENLKRTPKRDQSGCGSSFSWPLKDTKRLRMEFIFVYFFVWNPKRDHYGLKYWHILAFCPEHPRRDQRTEIYTPKRDDEHPHQFYMWVPPGEWHKHKLRISRYFRLPHAKMTYNSAGVFVSVIFKKEREEKVNEVCRRV